MPALEGLPARFGEAGPDDVVLHGDLHPLNVLLPASGPVVIDWSNASRGPAGADVADAWLLLAAADPGGGVLHRALAALLRRRFLAAFLAAAGRAEAAPYLSRAAELRELGDPNLSAAEKAEMRRLAASA